MEGLCHATTRGSRRGIATLLQARAYLSGALLCRYDHPATDCKIMGAEIDRRLSVSDGVE